MGALLPQVGQALASTGFALFHKQGAMSGLMHYVVTPDGFIFNTVIFLWMVVLLDVLVRFLSFSIKSSPGMK